VLRKVRVPVRFCDLRVLGKLGFPQLREGREHVSSAAEKLRGQQDCAGLKAINSGAGTVPNDATNRVPSPSTRRICTSVASHSRAAFAATVFNTAECQSASWQ